MATDSKTVATDVEATGAGASACPSKVQFTDAADDLTLVPSESSGASSTSALKEFFAAVVITFAQVPACVAFAALAKVPPILGLHAAWLVALPCALFGGRPGMIVGSAGALASVTRNFMGDDGSGLEILFMSIIGAGFMTSVAGSLGLGTYIGYVPAPVMIGFCNGLAIVIGSAQQEWFQTPGANKSWLTGKHLQFTIVHAAVALLIVMVLPKFKKTRKIPAHLTAVLVGMVLEWAIFRHFAWASPTSTVGESFAIEAGFPKPFFVDPLYDTSKIWKSTTHLILQTTTLAIVMSLESLLTVEIINDIADDEDVQRELGVQTCCGHLEQSDRQLVALGAGNIIAGFFGTMGGTALIELSVMNVHAGGKTRISSTLVPLFILAIILFASPVLKLLPTGVLAGILIDAVINTAKFESIPAVLCCIVNLFPDCCWSEETRRKIQQTMYTREDTFIVVLVTTVTCLTNLAYGVATGVMVRAVISGLEFQGAETHKDDGAVDQEEASKIARELVQQNYGITQGARGGRGGRGGATRNSKISRASVLRAPPSYGDDSD